MLMQKVFTVLYKRFLQCYVKGFYNVMLKVFTVLCQRFLQCYDAV